MAAKTAELIASGTEVICEAAFMDSDGNYCAADILRWDEASGCYDLYEVKNAPNIQASPRMKLVFCSFMAGPPFKNFARFAPG